LIAFLGGRFATFVLTLHADSLVIFLVLDVLPGDPAAIILGVNARADMLAALHHQVGLNRLVWAQHAHWIWHLPSRLP
jgi:peptide/nickel transport system permease protein